MVNMLVSKTIDGGSNPSARAKIILKHQKGKKWNWNNNNGEN
jgi:hypothetical protein